MTLLESVRLILRSPRIVLIALGLGLLASIGYYLIVPATYSAAVNLYVSSQSASSTNAAYEGTLLSQQRVKSYTELVTSQRVSSQVISTLGLDTTPESLSSSMTASSSPDSVVINIEVEDSEPMRAARIADATGIAFRDLVNDLERPVDPRALQPVEIRIVEPAEVPTAASSYGLPLLALVGLLLGGAVGSGIALAYSALDTRVRTVAALREVAPAPILGEVPESRAAAISRAGTAEARDPLWDEAFRSIRTNFQFVDVGRPSKVIAVTSSLPGEGKSTIVANLGPTFSLIGQRVLLVDADLRRPQLASHFNLDQTVGLTSVLSGRLHASAAIQHLAAPHNIDLLPSGLVPPNPSELLASQNMQYLLGELRAHYDVVLIDTPPLLPVTDAAALAANLDGVVVACQIGRLRSAEFAKAMERLESTSASILGILATKVTYPKRSKGSSSAYYYPSVQNGSIDDSLSSNENYTAQNEKVPALSRRPVPHRRGSQ